MILHTANKGVVFFWNCFWSSSPCHPWQEKFTQQQQWQMESEGVSSSTTNQSVICGIRTPVWILWFSQVLQLRNVSMPACVRTLHGCPWFKIVLHNLFVKWKTLLMTHLSNQAMFSLGAITSDCIHNTPTTHPQFLALEIHVCTRGLLLHPASLDVLWLSFSILVNCSV